jgi:hypothetical protein
MNSPCVTRRQFVRITTCAIGSSLLARPASLFAQTDPEGWDPEKPLARLGRQLKVQPVFMYSLPTRRGAASWKSWGGIQTEQAVQEELERIAGELERLAKQADFGLQIQPVAKVSSLDQVRSLSGQDWDVTLLYACTGRGELLEACLGLQKNNLIFVRHRSGPIYYWYEALSVRHLGTDASVRPPADKTSERPAHVEDVVVDEQGELLWRLRALQGVKNFLGTRVVALGGPWGKYAPEAPDKARERFGLEIIDVSYDDFAPRLRSALADAKQVATAEQWVERYLTLPKTRLRTDRKFVVKAFVLYQLFKDLMAEHRAPAFTIKACMGTILPLAQTTACLSLSLLNDQGLMAFCESDFVIIPAGLLLRFVSSKPVFLHNSTFPHQATVTCAHCTCPRRLDGKTYEPVQLVTHYESEYGAAPKVDMPIGQEVTFVDPEYSTTRWMGFKGVVRSNPSYDICRSQQDVEIQGDWQKLVREVRDSHWVMVYGDYLRELGYAARKLGMEWVALSGA